MIFNFLHAFNGDCILVSLIDEKGCNKNILIDGGTKETYVSGKKNAGELQYVIEEIRKHGQLIDLLILTHIDDDHIGGILKWFEKDPEASKLIGKVWFNSGRLIAEYLKEAPNEELEINLEIFDETDTSIEQGKKFEDYITENDIWDRKIIKNGEELLEFGLKFKILSPDEDKLNKLLKKWKKVQNTDTSGEGNDYNMSLKDLIKNDDFNEDTAYPNGSSIAFMLSTKEDNFLFLGDSHPSLITEQLQQQYKSSKENPLVVKFVKISHHGSKGNTSNELLEMLDCNNFIICTNGIKHDHPDKQCLARIINQDKKISLFFNYPEQISKIFNETDYNDYTNFKALPLKDAPF